MYQVVEKSVLASDICIVNAWIIYHTNYPDDKDPVTQGFSTEADRWVGTAAPWSEGQSKLPCSLERSWKDKEILQWSAAQWKALSNETLTKEEMRCVQQAQKKCGQEDPELL